MPNTRATKRVKYAHEISNDTVKITQEPPHEQHLAMLNKLPSHKFLAQYILNDTLSFRSPKRPNTEYKLQYLNARELDSKDLERCFALIEQTSRHDYAPSSRGWHPRRKRAEMRERNMRYVMVRATRSEADGQVVVDDESDGASGAASARASDSDDSATWPAEEPDLDDFGFLSFQLDDDWIPNCAERIPILYLYEIHLGTRLRGIGLGAHLMRLAEHIAIATQMSKIELSVFVSNQEAHDFYRSLGYSVDETSPETVQKGKQIIPTDWHVLSIDLREEPKTRH